eukprot:456688_1
MGGDIVLNGISSQDLTSYTMVLNGALFTFDPDQISSSDHLHFEWRCIDRINTNQSCTDLLDSAEDGIVNADFSTINGQDEYIYTFILSVYDGHNAQREHCIDYVQLTAHIDDTASDSIALSTTAIANRINVYDKVRIVVNVVHNAHVITSHLWHEVGGLLSDSQLVQYSESVDNSLNLVLQANVLTPGSTYAFQLEVFGDGQAYGISEVNAIYVFTEPRIITNSFRISPECTTNYASIHEYIQHKHSLFVIADADYPPLLYQFTYNNYYYAHPNLISTPYLNDIYMPIGSNTFTVHVYDAESALVKDSLHCNITLDSYAECVDFDVFDTLSDSFITDYEKQLYTLQISHVYLQYLFDYIDLIDKSEQCVRKTLSRTLTEINSNIEAYDLCENNMVIVLSQVWKLWMDLVVTMKWTAHFYNDRQSISNIEEILFGALDPCLYIKDHIGYDKVETELSVSIDSIVTNIVKIYHHDSDITSKLSTIETHDKYKHLLYSLAESVIAFIGATNNHEIYNLLSSALYVASLSTVSTSIPGESIVFQFDKFFVFTTRISDHNISVMAHNISIYIPDDILSSDRRNPNDNPFGDASDVVIVGIDTNETTVNISLSKSSKKCQEDAILSDQSISININDVNSNGSMHNLSSNIEFSFPCNAHTNSGCNTDYKCMWYDPTDDIWHNDGCDTIIDESNHRIICSCSHLTTFATIHNINKKCSHLMSDWFDSEYFDPLHLLFGALYALVSIYIMLEIYPFFIDKYLTIKQRSIVVMLLILLVAILYLLICITFCILKTFYILKTIVTVSLLVVQFVYLIIYSLIFYTWFQISHAWRPKHKIWNANMRRAIYAFNAVVATFLVIACSYVLVFSSSANMKYFLYFEIVWSVISLLLCTALVIYSILTTKVLLRSAKLAKSQQWGRQEAQLAKKLILINALIALFFIFSTVSTIYFTLNLNAFNLTYRAIDLFFNWTFIVLLCWMYRDAMKRTIVSDASKTYNFDKYYCLCSKHFVLTNRLVQLQLSRLGSESRTTRARHGTITNTTRESAVSPAVDSTTKQSELPSITDKNYKRTISKTGTFHGAAMSSASDLSPSSPSENTPTIAVKTPDFAIKITADDTGGVSATTPRSPRDKLLAYAQSMGSVNIGGFGGTFDTIDWDKN